MKLDVAIEVGRVVELDEKVYRLTAPNPGPMTGPGTNTYIVGGGNEFAVIDPGPIIDSHIEAIKNFVGDSLKWIIVTHTHGDHSPAAAILKEQTGAQCIGLVCDSAQQMQFQDSSFVADLEPTDGSMLLVDGVAIRAIYTPGHVSNHVCFLLEHTGLLFSGDHIMQGSTVAIVPPQGNMADYLHSLKILLNEPLDAIAPAHGLVIRQPSEEITKLIEHRLWREAKVLEHLTTESRTIAQLTPAIYDDVPESLHWAAKFSLYAHLEKLHDDGIVDRSNKLLLDSPEAVAKLDETSWWRVS